MVLTKKQKKSSRKHMDNRSNNRNKLSVLKYRAGVKEQAKASVRQQQAQHRSSGRGA